MKSKTKNLIPSKIRKNILDMAYNGSTVHIGCALCLVEIFAVIYRSHLRYDFSQPEDPNRDFLILSKGHGVMAQYACMKELGWLKEKDLLNYFSDGTELKGLSDSRVKGLEVTSGSLGHGLSVGVGIAFGHQINQTDQKTFIIVGDGELNEGSNWEAIMFASHHKLSNLNIIIDSNKLQSLDTTENTIDMIDLNSKFSAFGCEVTEFNGNNHDEINKAFTSKKYTNMPQVYIANTIKGKGVDFMENTVAWHYKSPSKDEYEKALDILLCAMNT